MAVPTSEVTEPEPIVAANGLIKRHGPVVAVHRVSFAIRRIEAAYHAEERRLFALVLSPIDDEQDEEAFLRVLGNIADRYEALLAASASKAPPGRPDAHD